MGLENDDGGDGSDRPEHRPHNERLQHAALGQGHLKQALHRTEQVNAYSAVVTRNHSSKSRLIALLLAAVPLVFPISGLHRFYAGKVGTGILWLLTFGLFGIGQIVDVIMIACGSFNDAAGRPISIWQPQDEGGPVRAAAKNMPLPPAVPKKSRPMQSQYAHALPSFLSTVLSLAATLMVFAGLLIALPLALQIPEAVSVNVFNSGLGKQFADVFGYEGWPNLFQNLGFPVAITLLICAGILMTIARRRDGIMHMLRSLVGVGGMLLSIAMVTASFHRHDSINRIWHPIADHLQADRIGPAIETFMQGVDSLPLVFAAIFLVVSILILAWPPKRHEVPQLQMDEEGV